MKNKPKRDESGKFIKGIVPSNKIIIPKEKLINLYKKTGTKKIAQKLGISKQCVLRNLEEYNIKKRKRGPPKKLPEYWKKALRTPKSVPAWNKNQTKYNNDSIKRTSDKLKGSKNIHWRPEIHTGEKVKCACGCGRKRLKYDKRGRERKYIQGHNKEGQFKMGQTTGEKSNNWKGGITSENEKIRKSKRYNIWREKVYKKDDYICQIGKKKTKNIVAHHIKPFADYPSLRFEVSNGVTLCRSCHLKLHKGVISNAW